MADSSLSNETTATTSQAQQELETPGALAAPTQSKSLGWTLLYGLANAIIGVGNITFYTLLLPARIAGLASGNQTNTFILIVTGSKLWRDAPCHASLGSRHNLLPMAFD